ncbi:MAG: glycosyltransferase [Myxococcota bacterium]
MRTEKVFTLDDIPRRATLPDVRVFYVTDRWSLRSRAGLHLQDVISAVAASGHLVHLIVGQVDQRPPESLPLTVLPGLRDHDALDALLSDADVIHVQDIDAPQTLARLTASGRAVVTIQDHRAFCLGFGKTLPDGRRCGHPMSDTACAVCLSERTQRSRALARAAARRDALAAAQRVITLSTYMARELDAVGISDAAVVPPWLTVPQRQPRGGKGFVLGGDWGSGIDAALAWQAWCDAETPQPLLLAGEQPEADALTGATPLGWLSREALHKHLLHARALLLPARWQEPFGILGVEALACATPVILTPRGGMADWAGSGCMPVHSVEDMAEAIRWLAAYPTEAMSLGMIGQQRVRAQFQPASLLQQLLTIYDVCAC